MNSGRALGFGSPRRTRRERIQERMDHMVRVHTSRQKHRQKTAEVAGNEMQKERPIGRDLDVEIAESGLSDRTKSCLRNEHEKDNRRRRRASEWVENRSTDRQKCGK
jgi:hypothetical protein